MGTITKIDTLGTPVNGTDDREAHSFHWYAARTQMNCERKVELRFQQIASETYLPIQEEVHQWSDRKKKVLRKVIPMVLFVKINSKEALKVHQRKDNQFYGFISSDRVGRCPAEIPDKDIEILKYMLGHSSQPISIEPMPIKLGDRVRVARGELQGLEGFVMQCKDSECQVVVIKLHILGYAKVKIHKTDLELI